MLRQAQTPQTVLVALLGPLFFLLLFLWAGRSAFSGDLSSDLGTFVHSGDSFVHSNGCWMEENEVLSGLNPALPFAGWRTDDGQVGADPPPGMPLRACPMSSSLVHCDVADSDEVAGRAIPGEVGGWLRSGPFTLVIRGGAYPGTKDIRLIADDGGSSCRIEPAGLAVRGVVLRCEMDLARPVVAVHLGRNGVRTEIEAERFEGRGYAQVAIRVLGEYRFEQR